jgi:CRISPR/Cas system CMR-associated protein Cmr5 small subunit
MSLSHEEISFNGYTLGGEETTSQPFGLRRTIDLITSVKNPHNKERFKRLAKEYGLTVEELLNLKARIRARDEASHKYQSRIQRANYYAAISRPGLRNTIAMVREAKEQGIALGSSLAELREHFGGSSRAIAQLARAVRKRQMKKIQPMQ